MNHLTIANDLLIISVNNEIMNYCLPRGIDPNQPMELVMNELQSIFIQSCRSGRLEIAKWLYCISQTDGNDKIDIHADNEFAFRLACYGGHLETAKWLY